MRNNPIVWRATATSPCPICGGKDACSATQDDLFFCWRKHCDAEGWIYFKDTANGFGMLRDTGRAHRNGIPKPARSGQADPAWVKVKPKVEVMTQIIMSEAKAGPAELGRLARRLSVSVAALQRLGVGFEPQSGEREPEHWLFPERDSGGHVIGLTRRYATGRKMQYPGTKRGLTFDPAQDFTKQSLILVPEGASDVAACISMGLCAVGRPNNLGGCELLGALLWPAKKAGALVVVMAERDEKPDGSWPGLEGAIRTAQRLADHWGEPVAYALPGEGHKDIRSWLVAQKGSPNDAAAMKKLGRKFVAGLKQRIVLCEPQYSIETGNCEDDERVSLRGDITLRLTRSSSSQLDLVAGFGTAALEVIRQGALCRPCPYAGVPVLQRLDNAHHAALLSVSCRQHGCRCCGPRLRSAWLIHITCKMLDTAAPLFCCAIPSAKKWDACKSRLRRSKANYIAISTADGNVLVISTVPLDESPEVQPFVAAERFAEALSNLAGCGRPINTSADWRKSDHELKTHTYRRVGSAPEGSFDKAVRQLKADHIEPTICRTTKGEKALFVLPEDWPEERTTPYLVALGWGVDPVAPEGGTPDSCQQDSPW
jgi:hypothetical protein